VSCAAAADDFCDCTSDGEDEVGALSAACASLPGARFFCPSGAKGVKGGALEPDAGGGHFIHASKIRDGVRDCVEGEDELPKGGG
jgi:hypothetical protein